MIELGDGRGVFDLFDCSVEVSFLSFAVVLSLKVLAMCVMWCEKVSGGSGRQSALRQGVRSSVR